MVSIPFKPLIGTKMPNCICLALFNPKILVGATVSDFGLPWDLLAEIDFLV